MADILIRGIEMPKENDILVFDIWHGKVYARSTANTGTRSYEVVPLPEGHGRIIDMDAPIRIASYDGSIHKTTLSWLLRKHPLLDFPKIIVPAEGGTDDDK